MQWVKKESLFYDMDKKEAVPFEQWTKKQLLNKLPQKIAKALGYDILEKQRKL